MPYHIILGMCNKRQQQQEKPENLSSWDLGVNVESQEIGIFKWQMEMDIVISPRLLVIVMLWLWFVCPCPAWL